MINKDLKHTSSGRLKCFFALRIGEEKAEKERRERRRILVIMVERMKWEWLGLCHWPIYISQCLPHNILFGYYVLRALVIIRLGKVSSEYFEPRNFLAEALSFLMLNISWFDESPKSRGQSPFEESDSHEQHKDLFLIKIVVHNYCENSIDKIWTMVVLNTTDCWSFSFARWSFFNAKGRFIQISGHLVLCSTDSDTPEVRSKVCMGW